MAKKFLIVDIDIDISEAKDKLKDMEDRSKDLRPVWRYAKKELEVAFTANFLSGGNLTPGGWAPLDRGYAAWKSINYPGARKLIIDGTLFRSVSDLDDPAVNKIEKRSAQFGTNVEYAPFHQYGTTKMPARQIIFEPKGFRNDIADKMESYVANGVIK